jgi:hypothetical protein
MRKSHTNGTFNNGTLNIICIYHIKYTLWLSNIAMENGPFICFSQLETSIDKGFSMAMLVITTWYIT